MTYLEKISELKEDIQHDLNHSDCISLSAIKEHNRIIDEVMYGDKGWDDEYK